MKSVFITIFSNFTIQVDDQLDQGNEWNSVYLAGQGFVTFL